MYPEPRPTSTSIGRGKHNACTDGVALGSTSAESGLPEGTIPKGPIETKTYPELCRAGLSL